MTNLKVELETKKKELDTLVERNQDLLDPEVYKKSCELDKLVVKVMRGWERDVVLSKKAGILVLVPMGDSNFTETGLVTLAGFI